MCDFFSGKFIGQKCHCYLLAELLSWGKTGKGDEFCNDTNKIMKVTYLTYPPHTGRLKSLKSCERKILAACCKSLFKKEPVASLITL